MGSFNRRKVLQGMAATALIIPGSSTMSLGQADQTPRRGGTLNVGQNQGNTKTLDALLGIQADERPVMYLLYNTLVSIKPDFSLEPELAASWKTENDGRRYLITLRNDVRFHDGTPFDAAAVKYNLDKRLDPATQSPHRAQLSAAVASIEVVSSHVIAINLNYAWPALMATLSDRAGLMVSPTAHAKLGPDFGREPVGTGPFKLKQWVQGTHLTLERNADYYLKDSVHLNEVAFRILPNTAVGAQRLNIGEIDYMENLSFTEVRQIDTSKGVKTHRMPIGRIYLLNWRVDQPPFNNPKLRQAISFAIDRNRLNQIIFDGEGTVANSLGHSKVWYAPQPTPAPEYSLDKAKALLKESGHDLAEPLTLWVSGEPTYQKMMTVLGEMLQQAGLKVQLSPIAQSEYFSRMVQGTVNCGVVQWVQRADPDMLYYWLMHSKGQSNTPRYNNPEMDRILEAARTTNDSNARVGLYNQVEQLLLRDLPYLPLLFGATYAAVGPKANGFVPMPDHLPRFRYMSKNA